MSKLVFVLGLLLGACLLSVCKCQRDGERKLGRSRAIERGGTKVIHTFMYTHTLSPQLLRMMNIDSIVATSLNVVNVFKQKM